MENKHFSEYIKDRYLDQIDWYDRKAQANQKIYRQLQWTLIILAALTPALIELDLDDLLYEGFGHLATLTSIVVVILTAALKTFKYQENWINYRTTCETLRREKYFYDARVGDYQNASNTEALFIERVESLMAGENTLWISTQKLDSKSEAQ